MFWRVDNGLKWKMLKSSNQRRINKSRKLYKNQKRKNKLKLSNNRKLKKNNSLQLSIINSSFNITLILFGSFHQQHLNKSKPYLSNFKKSWTIIYKILILDKKDKSKSQDKRSPSTQLRNSQRLKIILDRKKS